MREEFQFQDQGPDEDQKKSRPRPDCDQATRPDQIKFQSTDRGRNLEFRYEHRQLSTCGSELSNSSSVRW